MDIIKKSTFLYETTLRELAAIATDKSHPDFDAARTTIKMVKEAKRLGQKY